MSYSGYARLRERRLSVGRVRPLAIDLFTGLHGWSEGLVDEGWRVVGYDIEDMCAQFNQPRPEHVELILRDVLTIHGSEFKDADLIAASPPCQFFSYTAMPWTKAKQLAAEVRADPERLEKELALFKACFRIQAEASAAAGRHIPMVVENVRGAIPWVGRARYNYGSYYLWGDVPALMPNAAAVKVPSFRFDGNGGSFQSASVHHHGLKVPSEEGRRTDPGKGARFTSRDCGLEASGRKQGGDWFAAARKGGTGGTSASFSSKSPARKAASALIAKIPLILSRHIARVYKPQD